MGSLELVLRQAGYAIFAMVVVLTKISGTIGRNYIKCTVLTNEGYERQK